GTAGAADVSNDILRIFASAFEGDLCIATGAAMYGSSGRARLAGLVFLSDFGDVNGLALGTRHHDGITFLQSGQVVAGLDRLKFHKFARAAFGGFRFSRKGR